MSDRTTVRAIVREWLEAHGYDGLCRDGCGCDLDDLFAACKSTPATCVPWHRIVCPRCGSRSIVLHSGDECPKCGVNK